MYSPSEWSDGIMASLQRSLSIWSCPAACSSLDIGSSLLCLQCDRSLFMSILQPQTHSIMNGSLVILNQFSTNSFVRQPTRMSFKGVLTMFIVFLVIVDFCACCLMSLWGFAVGGLWGWRILGGGLAQSTGEMDPEGSSFLLVLMVLHGLDTLKKAVLLALVVAGTALVGNMAAGRAWSIWCVTS